MKDVVVIAAALSVIVMFACLAGVMLLSLSVLASMAYRDICSAIKRDR